MTKNPYLYAGRLEDVLFLIQYLGLGESYSIQKDTRPDGIAPRSCSDRLWVTVARDHPEFFRVTESASVTLAMRFYQRSRNGTPPPLSFELIQQLVSNAIALQERQAKRSEIWKAWATFVAALMAATTGIIQLFFEP